jgi:hypothetical protein
MIGTFHEYAFRCATELVGDIHEEEMYLENCLNCLLSKNGLNSARISVRMSAVFTLVSQMKKCSLNSALLSLNYGAKKVSILAQFLLTDATVLSHKMRSSSVKSMFRIFSTPLDPITIGTPIKISFTL